MANPDFISTAAQRRQELMRRWSLAREASVDPVRGPRAGLLLAEFGWVLEPPKRLFRDMPVAPARFPRTVMLLPGFGAHPARMRYMARKLEEAGHTAKRWGQGFNFGATLGRLTRAEQRLGELADRAGGPIHLVGWSLGGVIARELAKRQPDLVAKVVTLGSPFSGSPRANNGWRVYQAVAGHRVDEPLWDTDPSAKPPVPTIAMWSPRDGIVHPRSACGRAGERDRAIALRCTHMGFVLAEEAISAVLKELDAD